MLQFTEDCRLGIPEIDSEHERLFALVNKGYALLNQEENLRPAAKNLLKHLRDYADTHFIHEEEYMRKIDDPELSSQKREHVDFTNRMNAVDFSRLTDEQLHPALKNLLDYLARWLFGHILGSDILIGKFESPFAFTSKYATGIDEIDEEHRQLFRMVKETHDVIQDNLVFDKYDQIVYVVNRLKNYTKEHFKHEEAYMERVGYPGLEKQREAHQAFCDKLAEIQLEDMDNNQQAYLESLIEFLLNWLSVHILHMDKEIGNYLSALTHEINL